MATQTVVETSPHPPLTAMAVAAPVVGWLVPGAGHMMLRRWWRGLLIFACIVCMFWLGVQMQGKVYAPNTGDILDILGFLGDFGTGLLYLVTKGMGWGHSSIQLASADYGTKFMIIAGLLNVITAVDAHHIAIGKKR
ncbi:MAG TPA: DUF6677 family protein [Terriglobales bacterium]